jgi:hypothetical protein
MFKSVKELIEVLVKLKDDRTVDEFITVVAYALDDVLSLNDFKTLIERLKEDVEEDIEE